ncbi:MAG: hypothetical protein DI573_07855 [Microbacterium sp.]|uniref:DUF6804 family protein n=1 Tax=unclassified Microbacterium TaxID=2609290 RepID=UPI000DB4B31B|nr:DUF6804 family protein [Microbacterium sp.]PZU39155.1 MAG: hypothetical protein DI573_07855 [Microbacterium sp.]
MPKPAAVPETTRPAFLPGILAAAALLSGIPLIGADWYLLIRFIVAILALIVAWFAVQAGQWWWTIVFFVVAMAWNPLFPVPFDGPWWIVAHIAAAGLFAAAGALIRVPLPSESSPKKRR